MKKVNVLFLMVFVLFFALSCENDPEPEPEPEKVPEIPAVLQNTDWTHTSGDKISFTKDSVTITPYGGSAKTFKIIDASSVSQDGIKQTILYFKSNDSPEDTITYRNDSITMVNFSIINVLNRANGWSEGNNPVTGTYGAFTYSFTPSSVTITGYTGNGGNITIPETIDGKPVTAIGDFAFSTKKITGVTIPNSVTSIGSGAFMSNQIKSIIIPDNVTSIGDSAFYNTNITSITIGANVNFKRDGAYQTFNLGFGRRYSGKGTYTYIRNDEWTKSD